MYFLYRMKPMDLMIPMIRGMRVYHKSHWYWTQVTGMRKSYSVQDVLYYPAYC